MQTIYRIDRKATRLYTIRNLMLLCVLAWFGPLQFLIFVVIKVKLGWLIALIIIFCCVFFFTNLARAQVINRAAVLNETGLHTKGGVYFQSEELIPYDKIQDVIVGAGPLLRSLGLTQVTVQNAMGRPICLYGLTASSAADLRRALLEKLALHKS